MKFLAAFDFDHTIINDNTDVEVAALIQGGIPPELKKIHKTDGWTAFMQGVFDMLHSNGVTIDNILDVIVKLKPTEGMVYLIKELATSLNCDVIIISDSNLYFIDNWLTKYDLKKYIVKVFSNPVVVSQGHLKLEMYHFQDYCEISSKNLCKGQVLIDFIESQKSLKIFYESIIYCGDGANDFCPILRLGSNDYGFVRDKFKCSELVMRAKNGEIEKKNGIPQKVKGTVHVWETGYDILKILKTEPMFRCLSNI